MEVLRETFEGIEQAIPVVRIIGARSGPRLGVSAGMHGGEMVGTRAAIEVLRSLDPEALSGEVLVLPMISPRAAFARAIQLSPVDEREVHAQAVDSPARSYSHRLAHRLFELLKGLDYHVDMHSGEAIQPLDPWVSVPDGGTDEVRRATWALASCFPVRYLDPRRHVPAQGAVTTMGRPEEDGTIILGTGLPGALLDAGVANVWTEIGPNGWQDPGSVRMQVLGVMNALRHFGMLSGEPEGIPPQVVVGPRRWRPYAPRTGYWRAEVWAGDRVVPGQVLGRLFDLDHQLIEEFVSPLSGVVQYMYSSPAINAARTPHGNGWHRALLGIVEVHPSGSLDPRLDWTVPRMRNAAGFAEVPSAGALDPRSTSKVERSKD